MLDLDTGNVTGLGDLDADVEYFASIGSSVFYFIRTVNNATGYYFSDEPPTIENCLEHLEDFSEISVANYQADMICILTNNGQLSFLMYEREGADWGEYTYSTWNR